MSESTPEPVAVPNVPPVPESLSESSVEETEVVTSHAEDDDPTSNVGEEVPEDSA